MKKFLSLMFVFVISFGIATATPSITKNSNGTSTSTVYAAVDPYAYPGYLISYAPSRYDVNVFHMQSELNGFWGYGITCDGYFGSQTLNAVEAFQRAHGLSVDGIVGKLTWNSIMLN